MYRSNEKDSGYCIYNVRILILTPSPSYINIFSKYILYYKSRDKHKHNIYIIMRNKYYNYE